MEKRVYDFFTQRKVDQTLSHWDLLPVEKIYEFGQKLKASKNVIDYAIQLIKIAATKYLLLGHHPNSFPAATLYIAFKMDNDDRTQKEIADICGVTDVTVRNCLKLLIKEFPELKTVCEPTTTLRQRKILALLTNWGQMSTLNIKAMLKQEGIECSCDAIRYTLKTLKKRELVKGKKGGRRNQYVWTLK